VGSSLFGPADAEHCFRQALRGIDPATTIVALGHIPPRDDLVKILRELGVDFLFDGHWHATRVADRGGLREIGTQTLLTGGIDLTPAGYRVVTVHAGALTVRDDTVRDEPIVPGAPSDRERWATQTGGRLHLGAPAVADGRVFV